jgi:ABC-type transport system involved in multi-copper enzyme maturation permease subunit
MMWLTWRQFRGQLLTAVAILVALTAYLLYLGQAMRGSYNTDILGCVPADGCNLTAVKDRFLREYGSFVTMTGVLLNVVPAIIGIFWGAPLITRELEANTQRLVWNQSVTRRRWLGVKLAIIALASAAVTGAFSILLTWAASRYDQVQGNRFFALSFASRNVVPLGYAVFAFVLGTTLGLLIRRTLPAMAATLIIIAVVQVLVSAVARPHLQTPVTEKVAFSAGAINEHNANPMIPRDEPLQVDSYTIPGAMMLTSSSYLLNASGEKVYASQVQNCLNPQDNSDSTLDCIAQRNLHFEVSYQPANRYWPFQWRELAGYLALTLLLSGFVLWRIRHVRG